MHIVRANSVNAQWSFWVKPRASILTAALICKLGSNNVLLKCSYECSFLLLYSMQASYHAITAQNRPANGAKSNQDTHACHFSTAPIGVVC